MADTSLALHARSGIYEIVNTVNGKRYVGSAKCFRLRWKAHLFRLNRGTHHSAHLQSSWSKHGAEAFEFRIVLICAPKDLILYEQAAMDALAPEFNVCRVAGSALGVKHSAETKAKLSAAKMGNTATRGYKHRPESIAKLSASKIGNTHTKGKKRSPEAVAATAAAHRGMKRSAETCAKIAAKAKGRKFFRKSDEYREKLSAASKGRMPSPEHMAALQAGRSRQVYTADDRTAISAKCKAMWADPLKRAAILEKQRAARASRLP